MSKAMKINQDIPSELMFEIQNQINITQQVRGEKVFQKYFIIELLKKGLDKVKEENKLHSAGKK